MRVRTSFSPPGPSLRRFLGALALGTAQCVTIGLTLGVAHADDPFGPSKRPQGGTGAEKPAREGADLDKPPEVGQFKSWLCRDDWLCRALAARELSRRSDDGTVALLANVLLKESDARVLGVTLSALSGRSREDLLVEGGAPLAGRLVELLTHPHAGVAARALRVLEVLPPVRLGTDPQRYVAWWSKGREGLETEAKLATERREAAKAAARGSTAPVPGETRTCAPLAIERYRDLERIHREGLEVVVCLDATGSMVEVIDAAKASVVDLVRRMRALAPKFRVGLVTYDDGAEVRIALSTDEAAVEKEFKKVVAGGGGDPEEGVDKAIRLAMQQTKVAWSQKAMRVILVVGDAPPHEEDVPGLLRKIREGREDPMFESPVRIDTISTAAPGDGDDDGYVAHFREISREGHGAAVKLRRTRDLVTELLLAPFGPAWREPVRDLLLELEAFDRLADARRAPR